MYSFVTIVLHKAMSKDELGYGNLSKKEIAQ